MLAIDPAPAPETINPAGDPMAGVPVLTPWLRNLSYRFPVHCIGPEHQPQEPPGQPTFLLVFRKPDDQVGFLEINAMTARLVDMLAANREASGRDLLERLAVEAGLPPQQVLGFGEALYRQFVDLGVILGVDPLRN